MIELELKLGSVENQAAFVEISLRDVSIYEINIFDEVIFTSSQGESLNFKVESQVKLELEGGDRNIPIRIRQSDGVTSTL